MIMNNKVSRSAAGYFFNQCAGIWNNGVSSQPLNVNLFSFCKCHGVNTQVDFVNFIRDVADLLDEKNDSEE